MVRSTASVYLLRNLSAQGTLLNGLRVDREVILKDGDVISMGQVGSEYGSRPALQFKVHLAEEDLADEDLAGEDLAGEDLITRAPVSLCLWWLLPGPPVWE